LEFAEELATRYMDAHAGPRDKVVAAQAKNHCMGILLAEIGKDHGISAQEAFRSFGHRSNPIDLAMNLPFLLLYVLAADWVIRRMLKRYPPVDGGMATIVMIVLASVACAIGGLLLGGQWSILAESLRVGTNHLGNRVSRLPVSQHPLAAFAFFGLLSLGIASWRYGTGRDARLAEP
jgi:hypothetical protein